MFRIATAACGAWLILAHPVTAGTLVGFDMPGQTAICGAAIADDGTVAGNSLNTNPVANFLYQNGSFTTVSPNFARGFTAVTGINRSHALVGTNEIFGRNFTVTISGFTLRDEDQHSVHVPGAVTLSAVNINNDGTIVGAYQTDVNGPTLGYIKHGASITILNDGSGNVGPAGIDPTGTRVVGTSIAQSGAFAAWLWEAGHFMPISVPGAVATFASGINRAGTMSGTYLTGSLAAPVSHGYFYKGGRYVTYDVPGAAGTQLSGINAHGAVTGCYTDNAGTHGLIYTP
jgi:hypothetical protein